MGNLIYILLWVLYFVPLVNGSCPSNPFPYVYGGTTGNVTFNVVLLGKDKYFYVAGQTNDATVNPSATKAYPYPFTMKIDNSGKIIW